MVLFAGLRGKLENNKHVPESFKGVPITLVTASILSLSFMAFSGMVDGIFA
jgi:electron transport complex protein RnfA